MTYDQWVETYKPERNNDGFLKDYMGDPIPENDDWKHYWTHISGESDWIMPGFRRIDRIAIYRCAVRFESDDGETVKDEDDITVDY